MAYDISQEQPVAMEIPVKDDAVAVGRDTLGSILDLKALKASPYLRVCHGLLYDHAVNRINTQFPSVVPIQSFRYTKDELVQLSFA